LSQGISQNFNETKFKIMDGGSDKFIRIISGGKNAIQVFQRMVKWFNGLMNFNGIKAVIAQISVFPKAAKTFNGENEFNDDVDYFVHYLFNIHVLGLLINKNSVKNMTLFYFK
jgi:hypothetical protein